VPTHKKLMPIQNNGSYVAFIKKMCIQLHTHTNKLFFIHYQLELLFIAMQIFLC